MATPHHAEDLRGASFRGEQLATAGFSGADLRGADLSSANLRGADLHDARLAPPAPDRRGDPRVRDRMLTRGWRRDWTRPDCGSRCLYGDEWERQAGAGSMVIVIVVVAVVVFWKGIETALKAFGVAIVVLLAVGLVELDAGARAVGIVLVIAVAMLTGILGRVIGGSFGAWAIALVAVAGGLAAGQARGGLAALVISVSLVIISKRTLKFDRRDRTIRRVAHSLVRRWGTRFDGADLTDADFSGPSAANCNVTGALLDGVRWEPGHFPLPLEPFRQED